jgi:HSP20 family protein
MKNSTFAIVATVLILILGIQTYTIYRLNNRLDQLSQFKQPNDLPNLSIRPKSLIPDPPTQNDDYFSERNWNPYEEMQRMQDEMDKMFGKSFSRFHLKTPLGSLSKSPDVDLEDKTDHYLITVNAPGADKSSINVNVEGQLLHISIKTEQGKEEQNEDTDQYRYRERFVGELRRVLTLPGPVDASKMKSEYLNGVLNITIPKK